MGERNDNELVLPTFSKAFAKQKDVTGLVVHSDQGFQYTSHAYHDMLPKFGAQINMSRRGNCYDNASLESFFSHLKAEGLYPYHMIVNAHDFNIILNVKKYFLQWNIIARS
uniref:transposase n=1 Tax=Paenibacillus sp. FSL H3-0457 TaxID=2921430 RepID=UPI00403F216C